MPERLRRWLALVFVSFTSLVRLKFIRPASLVKDETLSLAAAAKYECDGSPGEGAMSAGEDAPTIWTVLPYSTSGSQSKSSERTREWPLIPRPPLRSLLKPNGLTLPGRW